jgi:hypothetical protein
MMKPAEKSSTESMERNAAPPEEKPVPDAADGQSVRAKTFARRALLRAGWTIPVILSVALPQSALAGSTHGDTLNPFSHGDATGPGGGHGDATFTHGDATRGAAHGDSSSSGSMPGIHGDSGLLHQDGVDP